MFKTDREYKEAMVPTSQGSMVLNDFDLNVLTYSDTR